MDFHPEEAAHVLQELVTMNDVRGKSAYKLSKERKNHAISQMLKPYAVRKPRKSVKPQEDAVSEVNGDEEAPADDIIEAPEAEGFKERVLQPGEIG